VESGGSFSPRCKSTGASPTSLLGIRVRPPAPRRPPSARVSPAPKTRIGYSAIRPSIPSISRACRKQGTECDLLPKPRPKLGNSFGAGSRIQPGKSQRFDRPYRQRAPVNNLAGKLTGLLRFAFLDPKSPQGRRHPAASPRGWGMGTSSNNKKSCMRIFI